MKSMHTNNSNGAAGFSLVEVTLAIGITAVALVSLMGMIPKGMRTLQKATDQAVMGRIHQQVLGEINITPWESPDGGNSPLEQFDGSIRIYDDQGIELPEREMGEKEHIYTARISIPAVGDKLPDRVGGAGFSGISLPGGGSGGVLASRLVIVEITAITAPDFLQNPQSGFDKLTGTGMVQVYRSIISKTGRDFDIK